MRQETVNRYRRQESRSGRPPATALLLLALVVAGCSSADAEVEMETGFLDRTVTLDGKSWRYQVYVPRDYAAGGPWPVVLFLHGAGERGDDGLLQTQVGLGASIRSDAERWPAIVVFPQVPEEERWTGPAGEAAMAALSRTEEEFDTDGDRIYLAGMSMGGQGVWHLAYHHPTRFAAMVPICAFVSETGFGPGVGPASVEDRPAEVARVVSGIPTWVVHGDADPLVPVEESRSMVAALEALGADVRYTELADVGHNAWDPAFAMTELSDWLFRQSR